MLDVKMPGLGGRSAGRSPQVVMLTGHSSLEDAERGKERGAFDYPTKPVQTDNLVRILFAAVGQQQG
jgi:DNA-binding response OmpR family regulator